MAEENKWEELTKEEKREKGKDVQAEMVLKERQCGGGSLWSAVVCPRSVDGGGRLFVRLCCRRDERKDREGKDGQGQKDGWDERPKCVHSPQPGGVWGAAGSAP